MILVLATAILLPAAIARACRPGPYRRPAPSWFELPRPVERTRR